MSKTITHLYLEGNMITDEGCKSLAIALKHNQSLIFLYLNNNRIEDEGVQTLAKELMTYNTSLRSVIIFNNQVSEECKKKVK